MSRLLPLTIALLIAAVPAAALASDGAGPRKARHTAKAAASRAARAHGENIPPAEWYASCTPRKHGGFSCRVGARFGQCSGYLNLTRRTGRAYAIRMYC